MATVDIADADGQLNRLVEQAESGETIDILRHGKLVAQIRSIAAAKKPVDLGLLQSVTSAIPAQEQSAAEAIRSLRDNDRY